MMKSRRSTRGLSPIFAVLILIAIAVIAGIVVYMFTSGFIGGLTTGTNTGSQKMSVQAASIDATGTTVTAYCQSTAGGDIALDSALLKDSSNNVVGTGVIATGSPVDNTLTTVTITITWTGATFASGSTYSITIVSTQGGTFVSPSFTAP